MDLSALPLIADLPRRHAQQTPNAPAVIFGGKTLTYRGLDRASNRVAQGLIAAGVTPGARVATLARDSAWAVAALFGTAKARAVVMGVNWRLAPPEVAYILSHGEAEVVFAEEATRAVIEKIQPDLPKLRKVIYLDGPASSADSFESWISHHPPKDPRLGGDAEEIVVQMYTSGTTGHPKGVMLPNRAFFAVIASMREVNDPWIGFIPKDVALLSFPLFHIGGLWWALTTWEAGACLVVVDSFVAHVSLELIARHGVTKTCMVPSMVNMLLAEPTCEETDFYTLDHMVYGGSPITLDCLTRAMKQFGCRFAQIYGLTETGNTAVCLRPSDHEQEHLLRAAGRPYPGVKAKVIDAVGKTLPPKAIGEICLHSPANMIGYWKNEEATNETLIEGWLHTGDAGFIDEDGYIFVQDRIKDMIISAGENIYPAEIESALASHPEIKEVAVIGIPDPKWGEQVKAIVVLEDGSEATPAMLIAHVRPQLADFKVPRSLDFVQQLPRTPSGKVQKGKLRAPFWEGSERHVN